VQTLRSQAAPGPSAAVYGLSCDGRRVRRADAPRTCVRQRAAFQLLGVRRERAGHACPILTRRGVRPQPVRLWWGPRPHAMRARQPVQRKHDWMIDTHVRTCSQPPLGPGGPPGALHSCTSMGGSTRACAAPPAHGLRVRHCTCCVLDACCRRSVPHCWCHMPCTTHSICA
jgi:hypothetical protein